MTMALMQMKHGCMETDFIRQILLSMDILLRQRKDLHQMTLYNGKLHIPKASQEIALNK